MDKIVHFEIPADDIGRARDFYSSTFGWKLDDVPGMDYTIIRTVEVDEQQLPVEPGAINGGLMKRSSDTPTPVVTVQVDSIDDAMKQIEAAGGRVVAARQEIPGMGAFGYFEDPEGNTLGLWETLG
jgi:uncharacterized protein